MNPVSPTFSPAEDPPMQPVFRSPAVAIPSYDWQRKLGRVGLSVVCKALHFQLVLRQLARR
jgi:hypothetical protein